MKSSRNLVLAGAAFALLMSACAGTPSDLAVSGLRCEYHENPVGIDAPSPRLSWSLLSQQRVKSQKAYQVLVASTREALEEDRGDLWDSGRIDSDRSLHVPYDGEPMNSRRRAWWKVRVWDEKGNASAYSRSGLWEMGLMRPEDWKAKWIYSGFDGKVPAPPLEGVSWIWFPEEKGDPAKAAPKGERFFRRSFNVPRNEGIQKAQIFITADDRFTLYVNGKQAGSGGDWGTLTLLDVKPLINPGPNVVAVSAHNNGGTAGLIAKLEVTLSDGKVVSVATDQWWGTTDGRQGGWETFSFEPANWKSAKELCKFGEPPWQGFTHPTTVEPSPHFRREFTLSKPVKSARAYICGLGYFELRINGKKVGDHVLDPAFTRYDRRALYVTHDVTKHLRSGANAAGVILGNGWYNMHTRAVWNFDRAPWRKTPRMICQIEVTYADGSAEMITSDLDWKVSGGPILFESIRNGTTYDARREMSGWDNPGFDDSKWKPAKFAEEPGGVLSAQTIRPMRVTQTITPVKVSEPKKGVYVFDMGQNIAGWAKLTVSGPAGTEVVLRYAERLNPDGTITQDGINSHIPINKDRFQTDTYILKGGGIETWEPRFAYHGFRYVEVTGMPGGKPVPHNVLGRVVHTDFRQTGSFECSNDLLNKIQNNTLWSYRGNFHGYPTDCPHREKNGWTGDGHLAAECGMYNFDNAAGYEKWMMDFKDEQRPDGNVPGIVPTSGWGYHWGNGPAWDAAYLHVPWYLHLYTGDTRIFDEHIDRHKRYLEFVRQRSPNLIANFGLGDWVPAKTETPANVTSTGYFYKDALIVAAAARALGRSEDAERYGKMAELIKDAFNKSFFDANTNKYAGGTQTAMSCALYQGLVDVAVRDQVVRNLVADIESKKGHLDTGVLGHKYILHALTQNGRADVAYTVASQTTFPSWGNWISQGATTLWEAWDGSGSHNHVFFGDISTWFYQALAGIHPDPKQPGFKNVIIRPHPVGDLTWAKAEVGTMRGKIRSSWKLEGSRFSLDITIPVNSTATVYLPGTGKVTEGGAPVEDVEGINVLMREGDRSVLQVGSGTWKFVVE